MGSALFIVISETIIFSYSSLDTAMVNFDPLRVAGQIVVGIGFLGAGVIMFSPDNFRVSGITTASGIWVSAAIGIACGFGLYFLAILATILSLFIFTVLWY